MLRSSVRLSRGSAASRVALAQNRCLQPLYQQQHHQIRFNSNQQQQGGGGGNVNFFTEFYNSFNRQVQENRDFQKNVKLLSDKTSEMAESDTMQRAKDAMNKGAQGTTKVVEKISYAAGKVGEGVGVVLDSAPVQTTVKVVGKAAEVVGKAAEPILETETAKTIGKGINTIQKDLSKNSVSPQYLEYKPKEIRDKDRAAKLAEASAARPVTANSTASSLVIAKESRWAQKWRTFQETNPLALRISDMSKKIEESENPAVERMREIWSRMSSVMDETEEAKCIKAFKSVDPSFRKHEFLNEATEFIIPEILEAHLKGDMKVISEWCSEKVYAEINASIELQKTAGLVSACKLLDIRRVEIKKFIFLDEQLPVIVMSFGTQEILLFKDRKTGEIKLGNEDHIDSPFYAVAFTKNQFMEPDAPVNPVTGGWKVITWSRSAGF